jgi:hypothetical protein
MTQEQIKEIVEGVELAEALSDELHLLMIKYRNKNLSSRRMVEVFGGAFGAVIAARQYEVTKCMEGEAHEEN